MQAENSGDNGINEAPDTGDIAAPEIRPLARADKARFNKEKARARAHSEIRARGVDRGAAALEGARAAGGADARRRCGSLADASVASESSRSVATEQRRPSSCNRAAARMRPSTRGADASAAKGGAWHMRLRQRGRRYGAATRYAEDAPNPRGGSTHATCSSAPEGSEASRESHDGSNQVRPPIGSNRGASRRAAKGQLPLSSA